MEKFKGTYQCHRSTYIQHVVWHIFEDCNKMQSGGTKAEQSRIYVHQNLKGQWLHFASPKFALNHWLSWTYIRATSTTSFDGLPWTPTTEISNNFDLDSLEANRPEDDAFRLLRNQAISVSSRDSLPGASALFWDFPLQLPAASTLHRFDGRPFCQTVAWRPSTWIPSYFTSVQRFVQLFYICCDTTTGCDRINGQITCVQTKSVSSTFYSEIVFFHVMIRFHSNWLYADAIKLSRN